VGEVRVSEAAFQAGFVRLVTDEGFLDRMRAGQARARGLTRREARDLCALARSPGLTVMRKLHLGFRLNKLLSMLPLTCRLLGTRRLAVEAKSFWANRAPVSFYFADEAEAFARFLETRRQSGLRVAYLDDVLAYEMALLLLKKPRAAGTDAPVVKVGFRHDPQALLGQLQEGLRPRCIRRKRTDLLGWADERGEAHWTAA